MSLAAGRCIVMLRTLLLSSIVLIGCARTTVLPSPAGVGAGSPDSGGVGGSVMSFGPTGGMSASNFQPPTSGIGGTGGVPSNDNACTRAASRVCGAWGEPCCPIDECSFNACDDGSSCCPDGRCGDCFEVPACAVQDEARCELNGCRAQYAYSAEPGRLGQGLVFAACVEASDACALNPNEDLTCTQDAAGALWVVPGACVPSSWKWRPGIACDIESFLCEPLDVARCEDSPWCTTIVGYAVDEDDAGDVGVALGCMRSEVVCTDAATCARKNEDEPEYRFPSGCIPRGWIACAEP